MYNPSATLQQPKSRPSHSPRILAQACQACRACRGSLLKETDCDRTMIKQVPLRLARAYKDLSSSRAHLKSGWTEVLPTIFWLEGRGFPLAFLFFPWCLSVFERLSSHLLVGGSLKMVGSNPAQPPNNFKMSVAPWIRAQQIKCFFTYCRRYGRGYPRLSWPIFRECIYDLSRKLEVSPR